MDDRDLVLVALSGVQRFISESRTTADLRSGSEIVAELAREAARLVGGVPNAQVVFPSVEAVSAGDDGIPNRVVALVEAGTGRDLAGAVAERLDEVWSEWAREVFGREMEKDPGIPSVQWACAPAEEGGYPAQWHAAQRALAARRRVRDFGPVQAEQRGLCSLSPRWPAARARPASLPRHEQETSTETLSVPNWVKRQWRYTQTGKGPSFPSASAIASAPYRAAVLNLTAAPGGRQIQEQVETLYTTAKEIDTVPWETAVPGLPHARGNAAEWLRRMGGRWVYPEFWQSEPLLYKFRDGIETSDDEKAAFRLLAGAGRKAAWNLVRLMRERGWAPPSTHLAVLAQDLDGMGRFLGGTSPNRAGQTIEVSLAGHQRISARLGEVASAQRSVLGTADLRGVTVYAGGDDLLALVPAESALRAARACHDAVPEELPTASTGMLFFHHRTPLLRVLDQAHAALEEAKNSSTAKHALAVGYIRRSGVRESCVQPWASAYGDGSSPLEDLEVFAVPSEAGAPTLSPGLLRDLERDEEALRHPDLHEKIYEAEFTRLVARHTHAEDRDTASAFAAAATRALLRMGARSSRKTGTRALPLAEARVAVFLRQEQR